MAEDMKEKKDWKLCKIGTIYPDTNRRTTTTTTNNNNNELRSV